MRKFISAGLAAAALAAISTPAMSAVTVTNTNGTPLDNQIYGIQNTGTTVYGSSPNNNNVANVTFTANTQVGIGAGFAQLNDATPNDPDWYSLIINPDQAFNAFKWAVQMTDQNANVTVYYLLTGSGLNANTIASYTLVGGNYAAGIGNLNKLLSGDNNESFDGFAIVSDRPIEFFEVKQLTFNGVPGAVPEPGTWALMLLGFGFVGSQLRRQRRRLMPQLG